MSVVVISMKAVPVLAVALAIGLGPSVAPSGAGEPSEPAGPGTTLTLNQVVTIAGTGESGSSGDGGLAVDANLNSGHVSVGPDGSVYLVDPDSAVVRKVDPQGIIDTVPGMASQSPAEWGPTTLGRGNAPRAAAVGPDGSLYVTSDLGIARVDPSGAVSVVAGAGDDTEGVDGARAVDVRIVRSSDIEVDADGNVYVIDPINARLRKIDSAGILTTVAGGGELSLRASEGLPASGANLVQDFGGPSSLEVDSRGNVYFMVESSGAVFTVDPAGILTMVTGTAEGFGGDGGPAIDAALGGGARSIAVDADDNLLVADGNDRIRMVDSEGTITTVGPRLPEARQIAVGPNGNLYFTTNAQVKMLVRSDEADGGAGAGDESAPGTSPWADEEPGTVITLAGAERAPDEEPEVAPDDPAPGEQRALDAELGRETRIAVDSQDRLLIADAQNERVDIVVDEMLEAFEPPERSLARATAIATSPAGDTYAAVGGEIVRVHPDGAVVTVAGGGPENGKVADGQNALTAPLDVADIAIGPDGTLHIADDLHNRLYTLGADGTIRVLVELGEFKVATPGGVAVGDDGTVYVADPKGHRVLAVNSAGEVTTVAGSGENHAPDDEIGDGSGDIGDGGPATDAPVINPNDVVVDSDGTLYVNGVYGIRRVDTDGTIMRVFASPSEPAGTTATMHHTPSDLALGPHGDLYFVDTSTSQVRVLVGPGEIARPFPWLWVAGAAGAVAVAGVAVLVVRRRVLRRTSL